MIKFLHYKIILILLFLQALSPVRGEYWEKVTNLPQRYNSNYWLDVFFLPSDPNRGWVCGYNGMVIRTIDGGATWQGTEIADAYHLESVHFPSASVGYTSGVEGIFKTTDGGQTWSNVTPANSVRLWGCYFISELEGVVIGGGCGDNQNFWKTTDGGTTWSLFSQQEPNTGLSDAIIFQSGGEGFAVSSGWLWRTTDGGSTWSQYSQTGPEIWQEEITYNNGSFILPYAGNGCAGGFDTGGIRFSTDNGFTWTNFTTGNAMFGSFILDRTTGWACGYNGAIYYTSNAGANWLKQDCGLQGVSLDDIWFTSPTNGWVVGAGVFHFVPDKRTLSRDQIYFGEACYPGIATDTLWLRNKSFNACNSSLSIQGANASDFAVLSPQANFSVQACDSQKIIVQFRPTGLGNRNATLDINAGGTNLSVTLFGKALQSTAKASDSIITLNNIYCGKYASDSIKWTADSPDERILAVDFSEGDKSVKYLSYFPRAILGEGIFTAFGGIPADTGWMTADYKVRLSPCDTVKLIKIRIYGVSSIINAPSLVTIENSICDSVIYFLPVSNTGNYKLIIDAMQFKQVSDKFRILGWTSGKSFPLIIEPGQADTLMISFNSDVFGKFAADLYLSNNDSTKTRGIKNPYYIRITGEKYKSILSPRKLSLSFGRVCIGDSSVKSVILKNIGNLDASITSNNKNTSDRQFLFNSGAVLINSVDSTSFRIVYKPTLTGLFRDTIYVMISPCGDTTFIYAEGEGISSELFVNPGIIKDYLQTGYPSTESIFLEARGNTPVLIRDLVLKSLPAAWQFSIKTQLPITLNPGDTATIFFVILSNIDGTFISDLCIGTESDCLLNQCLKLDFTSNSKKITVNPLIHHFGEMICEKSKISKSITITNAGTIRDTIIDIRIIQAGSSMNMENLPQFPYTLEPAGQFVLEVSYYPNDMGPYSGKIEIETSGNLKYEVSLDGSYYFSKISPPDTLISFGEFESCEPIITRNIQYHNSGNRADTVSITRNRPLAGITVITGESPTGDFLIIPPDSMSSLVIELDPSQFIIAGVISEEINLKSSLCNTIFKVNVEGELSKPLLTFVPESIDIGSIWKGDNADTSIKVYNYTKWDVDLRTVYFSPAVPGLTISSNLPPLLKSGDSLDIIFHFEALDFGQFNTKASLTWGVKCDDTSGAFIKVIVPPEFYKAEVRAGHYIAEPGTDLQLAIGVSELMPRLKPEALQFEFSYDKYLFVPRQVQFRSSDGYIPTDYLDVGGRISGTIQDDRISGIFSQKDSLILIEGTALVSIPDSTPIIINEFKLQTDKDYELTKRNGSLRVIKFCKPEGALRYILMPTFQASMRQSVFTDNLEIDLALKGEQRLLISLINSLGEYIKEWDVGSSDFAGHHFDLNGISPGMYLVRIENNYGQAWMKKFIILK